MKFKPVVIIALTLLIGFALGFLVSGFFVRGRIGKFQDMRTERGFKYHMQELLEADEQQMQTLGPILDRYAVRNREVFTSFRDDLHTLMRQFLEEVGPHINAEQKQRLEEKRHMFRKFMHPKPGRRPPDER